MNAEWLKNEVVSSIKVIHQCGFNVGAVVCDNHAGSICVFKELMSLFGGEDSDSL